MNYLFILTYLAERDAVVIGDFQTSGESMMKNILDRSLFIRVFIHAIYIFPTPTQHCIFKIKCEDSVGVAKKIKIK